jgi:hypothetical protein
MVAMTNHRMPKTIVIARGFSRPVAIHAAFVRGGLFSGYVPPARGGGAQAASALFCRGGFETRPYARAGGKHRQNRRIPPHSRPYARGRKRTRETSGPDAGCTRAVTPLL